MSRLAKKIEDQLLQENPDLAAEGLRPEIIWIPDRTVPDFRASLAQQIEIINGQDEESGIGEFLDRAAEDLFRA